MQDNHQTRPSLPFVAVVSIAAGVLAAVLFSMIGGYSGGASFFFGLLVAILVAIILWLLMGRAAPEAEVTPLASKTVAVAPARETTMSEADAAAVAHASLSADTAADDAVEKAPAAAAAPGAGQDVVSKVVADDAAETSSAPATTAQASSLMGDAGTSAEADPEPQPEPAPAPEAPKAAATAAPDPAPKAKVAPKVTAVADVAEAAPETLTAARGGQADDLKQIKGVGPGLEKTLNEMGFFHFDQIANWGEAEISWVDARLKFKGRIRRDNWVAQSQALAKGEETEFSSRVKKGGVY